MRQADVWDPPDDSTIGAVANRIVRDLYQRQHPPNLFRFDAGSAQRGRENAGATASARAAARRERRG